MRQAVLREYFDDSTGSPIQKKALWQGLSRYTRRRKGANPTHRHCSKDGVFIEIIASSLIQSDNERVVREALLNAISHRDYQLAGSVFIRQYRDKLVIESPGGFPYGITVENILDRQSPRNLLIAKIFQLCGLVERSGQGMNLIYELAVRETKALPDFKGTDPYLAKLTLSGQVIDKRMLTMFHKIGEERLEKLTTEDYILLSKFYSKNELDDISLEQLAHLAELGIVEGASISEVYRSPIGDLSVATTDRKEAIKIFIQEHRETKTADLVKAFSLSDGYMRALLREMVDDETLEKLGDGRYTRYKLRNKG